MKRFVLALGAVLAASCIASCAPEIRSGSRSYTLALPPGCSLEGSSGGSCYFTTDAGRERAIHIVYPHPMDQNFDPVALREDPEGYWAAEVAAQQGWQASHVEPVPGLRRAEARAFPPPPGADAFLWFIHDVNIVGQHTDNQGIRCTIYDPADGVWEEFTLDYMEYRQQGVPPDPGFAADAERVARTLRFGPPGARP